MIHFLYHWVYQDLWVPTWPNWFAGMTAAGAAWIAGHYILKGIHEHLDRNHAEQMAHISKIHKHLGIK